MMERVPMMIFGIKNNISKADWKEYIQILCFYIGVMGVIMTFVVKFFFNEAIEWLNHKNIDDVKGTLVLYFEMQALFGLTGFIALMLFIWRVNVCKENV
jgi:hypothetical protein